MTKNNEEAPVISTVKEAERRGFVVPWRKNDYSDIIYKATKRFELKANGMCYNQGDIVRIEPVII